VFAILEFLWLYEPVDADDSDNACAMVTCQRFFDTIHPTIKRGETLSLHAKIFHIGLAELKPSGYPTKASRSTTEQQKLRIK